MEDHELQHTTALDSSHAANGRGKGWFSSSGYGPTHGNESSGVRQSGYEFALTDQRGRQTALHISSQSHFTALTAVATDKTRATSFDVAAREAVAHAGDDQNVEQRRDARPGGLDPRPTFRDDETVIYESLHDVTERPIEIQPAARPDAARSREFSRVFAGPDRYRLDRAAELESSPPKRPEEFWLCHVPWSRPAR